MFKEVAEAIMSLSKTASRNKKEEILKANAGMHGFKEIMQFIYDPYVRTGIANAKLKKGVAGSHDSEVYTWDYIIDYFKKHPTGSQIDVNVARTFVDQYEKGSAEHTVAHGMVTKTLKIGVTAKTLNKLYGDTFIPMIGIMRAEHYDDFKTKVKGPFIATEKIDGARRLIIKEDGNVAMYTRSGHVDEGLVDIEREAAALPDNCVFDGELKAIGEFENCIELRQATNSIANTKGERHGLTFNIFDMIPIEAYKKGVSSHDAVTRKLMLGALFGDESIECLAPTLYKQLIEVHRIPYAFKYITSVPIEGIAKTEDDVRMLAEPIWRRGFEGIMLNTFDGKYDLTKTKSRDILKVKNVVEMTVTVVDIEEGKEGTKNEGTLGALVFRYKGYKVGCGSGLSQSQRDEWWANPGKIIGKQIEIDCFGESTNKQGEISVNCPIFKRVVGEE